MRGKLSLGPVVAIVTLIVPAAAPAGECPLATAGMTSLTGLEVLRDDDDQHSNLSGLACSSGGAGEGRCVLVQDEKYQFVTGTLNAQSLHFTTELELPKLQPKSEYDAEGVAFIGEDSFLILGSQGRKAKKCLKPNPSSRQITKVTLSATDGAATVSAIPDILPDLLQTAPGLAGLAGYFDKCLGTVRPDGAEGDWTPEQGINFEGVAAIGDTVFFGLRGPVINGQAQIVSMKLPDLLSGGVADMATVKAISLDLNNKQGIRDMIAYDGKLLILSGAENDGSGQPVLFLLDPVSTKLTEVCTLPVGATDGTPEAILRLPPQGGEERLLVLKDGVSGGDPREFNLTGLVK